MEENTEEVVLANFHLQDWIIEAVANYLASPAWKIPMVTFIDENCLCFDSEDENKFEYTKIHNDYKKFFEKVLGDMIATLGLTEDSVEKAFETAYVRPDTRPFIESLMAIDDFTYFKKMMVIRNMKLNDQALKYFYIIVVF